MTVFLIKVHIIIFMSKAKNEKNKRTSNHVTNSVTVVSMPPFLRIACIITFISKSKELNDLLALTYHASQSYTTSNHCYQLSLKCTSQHAMPASMLTACHFLSKYITLAQSNTYASQLYIHHIKSLISNITGLHQNSIDCYRFPIPRCAIWQHMLHMQPSQ